MGVHGGRRPMPPPPPYYKLLNQPTYVRAMGIITPSAEATTLWGGGGGGGGGGEEGSPLWSTGSVWGSAISLKFATELSLLITGMKFQYS